MRFWRNGSLIGPIIRITFKAEVDGGRREGEAPSEPCGKICVVI